MSDVPADALPDTQTYWPWLALRTGLRRGPPLWLEGCSTLTRATRLIIVVGSLGVLSGLLSWPALLGPVFVLDYAEPNRLLAMMGSSGPGLCFGLLIVVPLSRWHSRGGWLTWLSLPASAAAWLIALSIFSSLGGVRFFGNPDPFAPVAALTAGCVGALLLALWSSPPLSRWNCRAMSAAVAMGCISGGSFAIVDGHSPFTGLPGAISSVLQYLATSYPFTSFQSLVGIALSIPLWPQPVTGQELPNAGDAGPTSTQ